MRTFRRLPPLSNLLFENTFEQILHRVVSDSRPQSRILGVTAADRLSGSISKHCTSSCDEMTDADGYPQSDSGGFFKILASCEIANN